MKNPIDEYLQSSEGNKQRFHKELFSGDKEDIDLRTDLEGNDVRLLMRIGGVNEFLKQQGFAGVYDDVIIKFMRLRVSLDRKSRAEYVDVNKEAKPEINFPGMPGPGASPGAPKGLIK